MTSIPRGSTLIEMLVAILILGFTLMLFQSGIQSIAVSDTTHNRDIALKTARGELETLRALGYAALPASGSFSHASLALLPGGAGTRTMTSYNVKTKQVVVSVTWTEPKTGAAETVSLTTLITESGGL